MKWTATMAVAGLLTASNVLAAPIAQSEEDLPVVQPVMPSQSYIVTLKPGAQMNESVAWASGLQRRGLARRQETGEDIKTFNLFEFQGYAGTFDEAEAAEIEAQDDVCSCARTCFDANHARLP
jgi:hypothetical protein